MKFHYLNGLLPAHYIFIIHHMPYAMLSHIYKTLYHTPTRNRLRAPQRPKYFPKVQFVISALNVSNGTIHGTDLCISPISLFIGQTNIVHLSGAYRKAFVRPLSKIRMILICDSFFICLYNHP